MPLDLTLIALIVLALILIFIAFKLGQKYGSHKKEQYWLGELPGQRKDAIMKSRAVLGGHFTENLAPYLPTFPFLPTECRFVGKPVDFLVFKGMDEKEIGEVIFVEVKSGNAKLSPQEKNLKEAIDKKRVKFVEYRIPEELTKKGDVEDRIDGFVNGEEL